MPTETPLVEPLDAHNRALVSNVHPSDWVNPEPAGRYNLVVIGAGTAGLVTAAGAAALGAKVALVEAEHGSLPREDRDAAEIVQQAMSRDGVKLLCCGKNLAIKNNGGIRLAVESHGHSKRALQRPQKVYVPGNSLVYLH